MDICIKIQLLDSWRFPTIMDMMTLLLVTHRYKHMKMDMIIKIKPTVMKKAIDTDMGMMMNMNMRMTMNMDMENHRTVIKMMRAAVAGVVASTMMWHA